jgi:DNA-binding CsgD family transcriptional regulator
MTVILFLVIAAFICAIVSVKEHLYQAYKRLGVTGRVQAALAFKQRDI